MVSTASCTCSATCEITLALFPMALVCVPAAGVSLHNREPLDQFSNGVHGCATSNQVALIVVWASAAGTLHNGSCRYHRGSHLGNACAADCGIADVNYRTPKHFRFRRHQLPKLKDAVGAVHGSSMRAWPVLWYSAEHNTVNNQQKAELVVTRGSATRIWHGRQAWRCIVLFRCAAAGQRWPDLCPNPLV
jgi:hypothetical protein